MWELTVALGELLEPKDDVVRGRVYPRPSGDHLRANGLELGIFVNAVGGAFDADGVAGFEESLGGSRRYFECESIGCNWRPKLTW